MSAVRRGPEELAERAWHHVTRLRRSHSSPPSREQEQEPSVARGGGMDVAVREAAAWSGRFLLIVAALFVLWRMLDAISLVTISLTVATMISAVLRPGANVLTGRGLPRWMSGSVVFLVGVGVLTLIVWFVISQITSNTDIIAVQLMNAGRDISRWLSEGPLQMSEEQLNKITSDISNQLISAQGDMASRAFSTATSALSILSGAILCLFTLLFLLLDDGSIWRWVMSLFPAHAQAKVQDGGMVAWRTLVAYMRSTVLLAAINALTMVPVMMIAKIELYVPLGVLLFLGSLIPMVGMLVAGAVLVLIALVMNGPVIALVMGIALFLTIQLEGNLLNPYILGKAVNIHPLAILATVTAGTLAGGIFGAFIAVPAVAIINNVAAALRPRTSTPMPLVVEDDVEEAIVRERAAEPAAVRPDAPGRPATETP
ncbi:MAG: AI-2E family transporter [Austwickia sp.]|nr:AI-2E family transporter [Austwickia sp.]